ncbi:hypothetical protein OF83DRAFT_1098922 [Amylostereum chailletii]|nr:hypothetical protein OF83DRAFT_1098922 [Amylostereum chailletii]
MSSYGRPYAKTLKSSSTRWMYQSANDPDISRISFAFLVLQRITLNSEVTISQLFLELGSPQSTPPAPAPSPGSSLSSQRTSYFEPRKESPNASMYSAKQSIHGWQSSVPSASSSSGPASGASSGFAHSGFFENDRQFLTSGPAPVTLSPGRLSERLRLPMCGNKLNPLVASSPKAPQTPKYTHSRSCAPSPTTYSTYSTPRRVPSARSIPAALCSQPESQEPDTPTFQIVPASSPPAGDETRVASRLFFTPSPTMSCDVQTPKCDKGALENTPPTQVKSDGDTIMQDADTSLLMVRKPSFRIGDDGATPARGCSTPFDAHRGTRPFGASRLRNVLDPLEASTSSIHALEPSIVLKQSAFGTPVLLSASKSTTTVLAGNSSLPRENHGPSTPAPHSLSFLLSPLTPLTPLEATVSSEKEGRTRAPSTFLGTPAVGLSPYSSMKHSSEPPRVKRKRIAESPRLEVHQRGSTAQTNANDEPLALVVRRKAVAITPNATPQSSHLSLAWNFTSEVPPSSSTVNASPTKVPPQRCNSEAKAPAPSTILPPPQSSSANGIIKVPPVPIVKVCLRTVRRNAPDKVETVRTSYGSTPVNPRPRAASTSISTGTATTTKPSAKRKRSLGPESETFNWWSDKRKKPCNRPPKPKQESTPYVEGPFNWGYTPSRVAKGDREVRIGARTNVRMIPRSAEMEVDAAKVNPTPA